MEMNQQITDGKYDKTLAVKCANGTFVGVKKDNVISYKGIPFVGKQPELKIVDWERTYPLTKYYV